MIRVDHSITVSLVLCIPVYLLAGAYIVCLGEPHCNTICGLTANIPQLVVQQTMVSKHLKTHSKPKASQGEHVTLVLLQLCIRTSLII